MDLKVYRGGAFPTGNNLDNIDNNSYLLNLEGGQIAHKKNDILYVVGEKNSANMVLNPEIMVQDKDAMEEDVDVSLKVLAYGEVGIHTETDWEVRLKSDNSIVDVLSNMTLTTARMTGLQPNTEYIIKGRVTMGNIISGWGSITATTLESFSVTPTEGGYATGDRNATITISEDWVWHSSYSDITKLLDGITDSDSCVPDYKTDIGGKRIAFDFGEMVKVSNIKSYGGDNQIGTVKLQSSTDGTNWSTVKDDFTLEYSAAGTVYNVDNIVEGRYLSILGVSGKPANDHWYELEFGV